MSSRLTKVILTVVALGATQILPLGIASAQRVQTDTPTDGSMLPFPPVPSASLAAPRLQDSIHKRRAQPNHLREGAPNILIILMDDVGFGQASTFGGEVNTPTLSKLADQGISYNTFHTTSICSPTRAALLTGRNHQRVGNGTIAERAVDWDGYTGIIPKTSATMAEVLRDYGYKTAAIGKWHNTPADQTTSMGPFDRWPTGHGFDYFYGFLAGETSQWDPRLSRTPTRSSRRTTRNITSPKIWPNAASIGCDIIRRLLPTSRSSCIGHRAQAMGLTRFSRNGPTGTKASSRTAGMPTASASLPGRSR